MGDTTTEQGARSCVAQRTRSHTEILREQIEENRSQNISKLNKIMKDLKEEENTEKKGYKANDSLALPAYKKLHSTIEKLDKSFKEKNTLERNKVTWKDLESKVAEEEKDSTKPENLTYLMEDENYKSALEMIGDALGTLLEMELDTVNMDYMESIVRYILYICLDYNINIGNLQENLLEMGKQIKEYQQNSEMLEATKLENDRLNSEIQIQVSIADNYKKLWEVYKKNAEGKVKDAKGDEVELTKRLVDLERDLDKTTERYRAMFLKYSFAFSRKDEYKNCYFKLKLASEKEKERLEKQKQKLKERIEEWKVKAETEENLKLKLKFDYLNSENKIEKAESRATDLMSDMIIIRLRHDTELINLKESHDNSMKKIQKENEQLSKELAEKKQEVKNQRKNYGERMTDVRIRLDEAKAEERIIKAKLYANQETTKVLEPNLEQKEKENIDMKERMEMENRNNVKLWKEEVENLKKKLNEKTKVNTQETSPKETYMGDDTMFSTTSESRALEDLSTTGHLGDTEGLDNTKVQADLEYENELTSS